MPSKLNKTKGTKAIKRSRQGIVSHKVNINKQLRSIRLQEHFTATMIQPLAMATPSADLTVFHKLPQLRKQKKLMIFDFRAYIFNYYSTRIDFLLPNLN